MDKLKVFEQIVNFIADNKIIVSGMSKEIDSYAHTACPNAGGYIIVFVMDYICYTSEYAKIMNAIEYGT